MLKKTLLSILAALALIILLLLINQQQLLSILINRSAGKLINNQNIALQVDSPTLAFTGLNLRELAVSAKTGPIVSNVKLNDVALRVAPFSLLSNEKKVSVAAQVFDGKLDSQFALNSKERNITIAGSVQELNLTSLPILGFFGISTGLLSVSTEELNIAPDGVRGSVKISVNNFNKPQATKLPALLTRLPLDLEIPAIKDLKVETDLRLSPIEIEIYKLDLTSDLLKISNLRGKSRFRPGSRMRRLESFSYAGSFELSSAGHELLAPYLSLLGAKTQPEQEISFNVSQNLSTQLAPEFQISPK